MKQSLHISLVSGLVGVMLGAGSLYVVQTNLDTSARLYSAGEREEVTKGIREIQDDGIQNRDSEGESVTGTRGKKASW